MRTNPDPAAAPANAGLLAGLWRAVYGTYSLTLLALLVTVATIVALLLPVLSWRRASTRFLARLWLVAAGLRLRVRGLDSLPEGSCVLVANHSSYLDGVLMKAALPPRFSFVIKREAKSMPVIGFLLRRIGSEFVDRHSTGGRQRDARRVVRRAEQGHSLVFFPEGTFDATVGLKRFRVGAFVAAARGGMPLVPSVLLGARRALPSGHIVPRPGRIELIVLPPLASEGRTVEWLRGESRRQMLEHIDDPDLEATPESTAAA